MAQMRGSAWLTVPAPKALQSRSALARRYRDILSPSSPATLAAIPRKRKRSSFAAPLNWQSGASRLRQKQWPATRSISGNTQQQPTPYGVFSGNNQGAPYARRESGDPYKERGRRQVAPQFARTVGTQSYLGTISRIVCCCLIAAITRRTPRTERKRYG